jgi:hypothetical protein
MIEIEPLTAVEVLHWQQAGKRKGPRGRIFICVHVNEDEYANWCAENGLHADDEESRAKFVLYLAFREWLLDD